MESIPTREELISVSLKGIGDGTINDDPALPLIDKFEEDPELKTALSRIAYARIATTIKFIGYCEAKQIIPTFNSEGYSRVVNRLMSNSAGFLQRASAEEDVDSYWVRLNRLQSILHQEHLDNAKLSAIPLSEVLKLRTRSWGKAADAREQLSDALHRMATEIEADGAFEEAARTAMKDYFRVAKELESERKSLHYRIRCDLAQAALVAGVAINQFQSQFKSMELTLAAAMLYTLIKSVPYKSILEQMKAKEDSLKSTAGFALTSGLKGLTR